MFVNTYSYHVCFCWHLQAKTSQKYMTQYLPITAVIFPKIAQSQQYLRHRSIQLIINSISAIGAALPKVSLLYCSIPACYCYNISTIVQLQQQYLRHRSIQLIINSIGAIGAALPKVSLLYCSIPDCYCYNIYTNCKITTILKV